MPIHLKLGHATLACSLLLCCGLPASVVNAAPTPDSKDRGVERVSDVQKIDRVRSVLVLQPGDEEVMRAAILEPLVFIESARNREFTGELIVHAKSDRAPVARARLGQTVVKSSAFVDEFTIVVPDGVSEGEFAAMLMATGDYKFVEPNWMLFPLNTPNDPQFGSSWQHTRIQSAAAWDLHTGESDIVVAVCDTGVDTNHPDLQDALVPGYNAVNNLSQADGANIEDINGHGTFVSGCAAAQGNNGTGVVGAGWDFRVMPVRVSNIASGNANAFDLLEGSRWAIDNGATVVNVSYSGGGGSGNQTTAKYIIDRGGLLFWAAGNDNAFVGFDGIDLVMVGSTTFSDNKSGFSNFGTGVDLVAPGSSVRSTRVGGGYGNGSGTSYASPIAAGVGAMIFSVRSDLSGQDVQDILYNSVDDLGAPGRDNSFGRGRVNTFNAMQDALVYTPRMPIPVSEPFESASWMDLFSITSGSVSTVVDAESSGAGSVLLLDGSDQITSTPLGGTMITQLPVISYGLKIDGAVSGDTLTLESLRSDGSWQTLLDYTATGTDTQGYLQFAMQLPIEFRWHGVQIRITADGAGASSQWLIDDFTIELPSNVPVAPFVDSFETGVVSALSWESNTGVGVGISNSTHAAEFIGEQVIESFDIPMLQFGIAPGFIRVDAWAGPGASGDDSIEFEIQNVAGVWESLGIIDAGSLGTSPETFEFQTPITAWAFDGLRLRMSSSSDDPIYIDNVYVGPDQLTSACSDADFTADGILDFFDISAFLSAFTSGNIEADLNNDGVLDFFDISRFLTIFGQGCP
ncbi:MAG: S8 family serine peptidase [Phycisphaerales bacterium]|nr:S8 family serine peptidase [Phycisphaerales bacterium]